MTLFKSKKIKGLWYCFGTVDGYDYSFCSDNEYDAIELAKTRMKDKSATCQFPKAQ